MTMAEKKKGKMKRRAFLITGGLLGGGLVVGVGGIVWMNKKIKQYTGEGFGGENLNAWISITPQNQVTIAVPRAEMGQGVSTSVPMLIAEELEVDINEVTVIHPQPESPYANTQLFTSAPRNIYEGLTMQEKIAHVVPIVGTGGSTTIPDGYDNMRMAGAQAREMLIAAAADKWNVDRSSCYAESGQVFHSNSNQKATYGELVENAKKFASTDLVKLKEAKEFKIINSKKVKRLDIPDKVTGQATFGIDARPEGMLYAVIKHPSVIGGKITGIKNEEEVLAMDGIKKVVMIPQGVAIIADNTWRARNGMLVLEVEESAEGNEKVTDDYISRVLDDALEGSVTATHEEIGKVEDVLSSSSDVLDVTYEVPYLAHATMEPLNCTVQVNDETVDVWVGHQAPSFARDVISKVTGVGKDKVNLHITYLGGGFGRRAENDFTAKAAEVANQMKGVPVQLVFTREEDMTNDMYRPAVKSRMKAVIADNGNIAAWDHKVATQSVVNSSMSRIMPMMAPKPKDDPSTTEGAIHLPYHFENKRVSLGNADLPMEVGFWRSVGNSQNAFFSECFMDECAHTAGQDPYQYRHNLMKDYPRFQAVLDRAAEMADWGNQKEGVYQGIAILKSFGSIVAEVAEISQNGDKEFSIDKYYCAIDCGKTVHPDTIKAQMEGGIIFGLSAALYGKITFNQGRVRETNFPQYDMVRMNVSPLTEVSIINSDDYPGGVGEPGTPPAAPALCNALFAATGVRERKLPLVEAGYTFV